MKTRSDTSGPPKRLNWKRPMGKILTLKERVLAIKAYYRKPIYSKVAKKFKCDWEQIKTIIKERKAFLDYYEMATAHVTTLTVDELIIRRQKLTLLGDCMYEYIQRAQYHKNAILDDKVLIAQASDFSYLMSIKNFIPTKSWLKQFKISYKIPLSAQTIRLTRTPPVTLNPEKIISFCKGWSCSKNLEMNLQTGKKNGESKDPQASKTSTSSKSKSKAHTTVESELRQRRRQKINLLEKALYEFIERAQYHRKVLLNEDLHIKIACKFNDILKIENFTPNKNWIKHFKLHYNINTSQRMIVVNRTPLYSLNLQDILRYCREMDSKNSCASPTTVSIGDEDAQIEENKEEKQQNLQPKLILNSGVKPETIVELKFHNVDEVDIKPDMTEIEFELLEDDDEMEHPALKMQQIESMHVDKTTTKQPANSFDHCSDEEEIKPDITNIQIEMQEDDVEVEEPALKIQQIESMHEDKTTLEKPANSFDHCSDEEDIKPNITNIQIDMQEDDDVEVEQPPLKMQKIESNHYVGQSTSEKLANSSGQESHEGSDDEVPPMHDNINKNQTIHFSMHSIAKKTILTQEIRKQKIEFLGQCMFEYIQRAQLHPNTYLNNDILIDMATKFNEVLQIKNFTAGKSWLNRFKVTYILPLYQRQIVLKRTIPGSLNPQHIVAYLRRQQTGMRKNCQDKKRMDTKSSTTELMKSPANAITTEDELRTFRQHKIETLEKALYEYIQRSQYHKNMPLNEDLQIKIAGELEKILNWLKHFKLHYNINTSQRIPPSLLDLKDILSYCGHTYRRSELTSPETVTLDNVDTQECEKEQKPHLQLEEQEVQEEQIVIDLEVQPETEFNLEVQPDEDIKLDIMDIKIEFPQEQKQVQPLLLCTSAEKEKEEVQPTTLENQNMDSFQMDDSSDDEVLPKLTKSYADALKKLKSLEEFSLLEENYRAIGLITQLENIFKNPPS